MEENQEAAEIKARTNTVLTNASRGMWNGPSLISAIERENFPKPTAALPHMVQVLGV